MSNRILDYPEATEITSNDYILLDNEGSGAKCIKASALNINMDNYTIKEARGAIASFEDGEDLPLAFMGAYITAIQDLHGYDNPWVGGSGKNKYGGTFTLSGLSNNDGTFTNTITDSRTYFSFAVQTYNGNTLVSNTSKPIGETGRTSLTFDVTSEVTKLRIKHSGSARDLYVDIPFTLTGQFTISLDVVGCNPSVVGGLVFKDVQVESGNTATTFAPYSNICPISGWTACNVVRTGKNLFDAQDIVTKSGHTNYTYIEDGYLYYNAGNPTANGINWYGLNFPCPLTFSGSIKNFSSSNENVIFYATFDDGTESQIIIIQQLTPNEEYSFSVNIGVSGKKLVSLQNSWASARKLGFNLATTQLELGSTATTYSPYNGHTYTIDLDGTRYGGKVDVISGVLTVDRAYVDLGTLDWQYSSISKRFYVGASDLGVKGTDASTPFNAISSALIAKSYNEIDAKTVDYAIGINPNATQFFARYSSITSASDFITAMDGVQLVYELATPLTYQLTKQQIRSLVGVNNIFADTGDSVVDYRKLWVMPEM